MRMFRAALDYHELNAGAHRKSAKVLTAPSLIWHLAFWTNVRRKKTPDEIKDTLDKFIIAFCGAVAGKVTDLKLSPCISDICLLFHNTCRKGQLAPGQIKLDQRQHDIFASTSREVSVQFVWLKLDVTVRFEIRSEYFSITTFVELDKAHEKIARGEPYSGVDALNNTIGIVLGYLRAPDKPSQPTLADALTKSVNEYFFRDFWNTYEAELLSDPSLTVLMKDRVFKQVFADFRGLIASEQAVKFVDDGFFTEDKLPKWGQEAKGKFLPLIQHRDRAEQSRYECVMNYMLDGRAFYMSTLGPQVPSIPAKQRIPVEFVIYANQRTPNDAEKMINNWQLGRLVNQILRLGTLRLCALKDVKLLREAGQQLGLLDQSTQAARYAIASNDTKAMELIGEAHKKLNSITGRFLRKTGSGLLYRIERSRYYVQQFEENVKVLRIKRLEGDQPYDQFIRRRLGPEFDFIDRLGIRFERATNTIVTLDQNYLAITQNALVKQANQIDENIHAIQEWGEFALLAALVPYYVMHLLDLIIKEKYVPVLTASVWTVFGALALYRKFKKSRYALFFLAIALPGVFAVAWPLLSHPAADWSILRVHEMQEKQLDAQKEMLDLQKKQEKLLEDGFVILRELHELQRSPAGAAEHGTQAPRPGQPSPKP
jgi:hypothetical protein